MVQKNGSEKLIARIVYNGPVRAPIKEGQRSAWSGSGAAPMSRWRRRSMPPKSIGTGSTMRRAIDGASELVIGMFRAGAEKL